MKVEIPKEIPIEIKLVFKVNGKDTVSVTDLAHALKCPGKLILNNLYCTHFKEEINDKGDTIKITTNLVSKKSV